VRPDCETPNVGSVGPLPALPSLLAGCPQHCDDLLQIVGEPIMTTIGLHPLRKRPYEVTYDQEHPWLSGCGETPRTRGVMTGDS